MFIILFFFCHLLGFRNFCLFLLALSDCRDHLCLVVVKNINSPIFSNGISMITNDIMVSVVCLREV